MSKAKDDVISQKQFLAAESLKLANQALGFLEDQISECSTRDLVAIYSAAVKVHREITTDIVALQDPESKSEAELAREYTPTIDKLLEQLKKKGN